MANNRFRGSDERARPEGEPGYEDHRGGSPTGWMLATVTLASVAAVLLLGDRGGPASRAPTGSPTSESARKDGRSGSPGGPTKGAEVRPMLPSTPTPMVRNRLALERALAAAPSPVAAETVLPTADRALQGENGRSTGREDLPEADRLAAFESPVSAAIGPLEFADKLSRDLSVPAVGARGDGSDRADAPAGRTVHGRLGSLRVLTERIERAGALRFAMRLDGKAVRRGGGRAHAYMDCELVGRAPADAGEVQYALCHGRRLHAGDNPVRLRLPEAIPPGSYRLVTRVWKSESRPETLQHHVSVVDSLASVATRPGLRKGAGSERSTARSARRSHPTVADAKGPTRGGSDAQASEPYRDLQNPLYPGYRRP